MLLALTMIALACASPQLDSEEDRLATFLLAINPKTGIRPTLHRQSKSMHQLRENSLVNHRSLPRRSSVPQAVLDQISNALKGTVAGGKGKKIVVVGACSKTGDFVARQLSTAFSVTVFCVEEMAKKVLDDNGPLSGAKVKFLEEEAAVDADAVVLAFDDAPPVESVTSLLKSCKDSGIGHVVLLSRLGATKGGFNKWGPVEDAAIKGFGQQGLSILRVGGPLEGGPYYAKEVDVIKWSSSQAINGYKNYQVAAGDELAQGGVGSPRGGAANGIAALLRRGPEAQLATYSLTSDTAEAAKPATTPAQLDAMLNEAGGTVSSPSGGSTAWKVNLDDSKIAALTLPQAAEGPNIIDLLFNSPPAVSGSYWGVIILFVWGTYITSTPDYVAKTGIDLWR